MKRGNSVITLPLLIAFATIAIGILSIFLINLIKPYILYEKLLSTSLRYMFVLEEYGYLNENDKKLLINELENQGFKKENILIDTTKEKMKYGDSVYLIIEYRYNMSLPFFKDNSLAIDKEKKDILMRVVKYGVCKT